MVVIIVVVVGIDARLLAIVQMPLCIVLDAATAASVTILSPRVTLPRAIARQVDATLATQTNLAPIAKDAIITLVVPQTLLGHTQALSRVTTLHMCTGELGHRVAIELMTQIRQAIATPVRTVAHIVVAATVVVTGTRHRALD
jgi:hypothetical protein